VVAYADSHLDVLRLPAGQTPSGYRNVYRRSHGRWEAAVKWGRRLYSLGVARSPRDAARLVAAWYESRYGALWTLVVTRRRAPPREVRRDPTTGGWLVYVWEWGRCVTLGDHLHPTRPARDWSARRRPWVFPTRRAAGDALRRWESVGRVNRWGFLAPASLGR